MKPLPPIGGLTRVDLVGWEWRWVALIAYRINAPQGDHCTLWGLRVFGWHLPVWCQLPRGFSALLWPDAERTK